MQLNMLQKSRKKYQKKKGEGSSLHDKHTQWIKQAFGGTRCHNSSIIANVTHKNA